MNQAKNDSFDIDRFRERRGKVLFIIGVVVMVVTVMQGFFLEREMIATMMRHVQQIRTAGMPPRSPIMGRVFLFAFGFPIGLVILYIASLMINRERASKIRASLGIGFLLLSVVAFTPRIFGWETSNSYFGIGGFLILGLIVTTFWFWSRYRLGLNPALKRAADFKALGYLCFGIAAWNICGFGNAPSFALFPEKMLEHGIRPFAIGQLKAIMAYLVLGWMFTAIGFFKSASTKNK